MTLEPLRSAMSIGNVEDTSLALPSDKNLRSGQQRVLDQVHTIKRRTKTSGSLSPTSPQDNVFSEFRSFKFSPTISNATMFSWGNSSGGTGYKKQVTKQASRTLSTRTQWEKRLQSASVPNGLPSGKLKPSRSDPSLGPFSGTLRTVSRGATLQNRPSRSSVHVPGIDFSRFLSSSSFQNRVVRELSSQSNGESRASLIRTKTELAGLNGTGSSVDITMKEAVEFLSNPSQKKQLCGASFIQHSTFKDDQAKQEVLRLNGIPALVALMGSSSDLVHQTTAAALRNLVFKDNANKLEVQRCEGIGRALELLKETSSTETQRQLTGLLWNLSSADSLKPELVKSALPVLTESLVVPFTGWSDYSATNNVDPEVFHSATGCLRNLSCANESERQAMRVCPNLIDSLVSYVQSCVIAERPDDKSVENCVCILHNLTYQLEVEAASHFSALTSPTSSPSRSAPVRKTSNIGCFSPQGSKMEEQNLFDYPVTEDHDPKGLDLLFHSKTIQMYLSLLGSSQKESTLEACSGALQNLTANKGIVSGVMSQTIIQKLNGLQHIAPLLQSSSPSLQKTVLSLVGNLSRTPGLQGTMAKMVLPQLPSILSSKAKDKSGSDETLLTVCRTMHSLILAEPEMGKKVLNSSLVNSLNDLSNNSYLPKSSKAASLLLYGLWAEKDIQGFLKKQGMNKSSFVNDITNAAHKSAQVIA